MFEKTLKSLGLPTALIKELVKAAADDKHEFDAEPMISEFKDNQKKLFENDPDIIGEIARKEQGKLLDIWTKNIRTEFGLDAASVKDKKMAEVIKLAKEEATKSLGKDLQTVQAENLELQNKIKQAYEVEIPKIQSEVETQKKNFLIKEKVKGKVPVADLRVPTETVDIVLNAQLHALYDMDLDDKGEMLIFNKGTKLQAKSADGTKLLTLDDAMNDVLKRNKFIKESNADDIDPATGKKKEIKPAGKEDEDPDKKKPAVAANPHLAEAIKHAEKLKADKAAAGAAQ